ncbi:MAG: C-terminal binding protein [Armatimonadetes bacterium]|nr:C-terminal binding protein [Armatimonadota bacterium]
MSKFRVAVTDYVFPNLEPEREILAEIGAEVVGCRDASREEVTELVRGADAVLNTYFKPIDADMLDAMPGCRIIVRYGIGVDTIDIPAATQRGIMVANVPDYCTDEVSDHAMALLLALLRRISQSDHNVRSGNWDLDALRPLRRISALTIGLIGMGRIGRAIASKVAAFGPQVIFYDPYCDADPLLTAKAVDLLELLRSSDAIIVQAPANQETMHLLNSAAFDAMERKPVIVNCARGELIDTNALIDALDRGQISGVGLDVIEGAPPVAEDSPLLRYENVILTPHSAWFSGEALVSLQRLAAMEVARALQGERPVSLLNPEALNKRPILTDRRSES